jgi:hypothetical protein
MAHQNEAKKQSINRVVMRLDVRICVRQPRGRHAIHYSTQQSASGGRHGGRCIRTDVFGRDFP